MIELKPFLSERVWGGDELKRLKKISTEQFPTPLGETWEISTHIEGESRVCLDNDTQTLKQYLKKELSYLVKFISCEDNLSVQVHPHDEYARMHENSKGKTECWIILDVKDNGGIYLGFKPGITKEIFQEKVLHNQDVSECLNFYPVRPGDFFYVPAGSVHALAKGVTLVEVQQSSGVTYRVWDWNRLGLDGKPRELHVKKSFDVLNFNADKNNLNAFRFQPDVFSTIEQNVLAEHEDFQLKIINMKKNDKKSITVDPAKTTSIVFLNGEFRNNNQTVRGYSSYLLSGSVLDVECVESGSFLLVK
ncbi:MAG: class I mannose-6-phosphate isomerase [Bacteriovoracaceae bacterium]|nr:class I mannose-6-phosphate isomerase [Bacteriovoracaceae bacterium]